MAMGCQTTTKSISMIPIHDTEWRESLKDGEVLKACLYENLLIEDDLMYDGWSPWNLALEFKEQAGELPDERIRNALLDIYREAEAKPGRDARYIMVRTVLWLGAYPDEVTKKFLLDVASTIKKDGFLRTTAQGWGQQSSLVMVASHG